MATVDPRSTPAVFKAAPYPVEIPGARKSQNVDVRNNHKKRKEKARKHAECRTYRILKGTLFPGEQPDSPADGEIISEAVA